MLFYRLTCQFGLLKMISCPTEKRNPYKNFSQSLDTISKMGSSQKIERTIQKTGC